MSPSKKRAAGVFVLDQTTFFSSNGCRACRSDRPPVPPPWSVDELEACLVVTDSGGQKLAYVYFEDEPGGRSAAKLLSKAEAHCAQGRQIVCAAIGRKANESHFWRDGMPILKLVANARTKIYETKLYGDMTSPSKPRRCGAMEHSRPLPLRACN